MSEPVIEGTEPMTREEFYKYYADGDPRITPEWLAANGRVAVPCDCGDELCLGWAMGRA